MVCRPSRVTLLTALAALVAAVPAAADHYRGVRATITSQNPATGQVTINVTVYGDPFVIASHLGVLGNGQNFLGVDWGDGLSPVPNSQTVPFLDFSGPSGTSRSRGSFSHTYASAAQRTIRVSAGSAAGTVGAPGNTRWRETRCS